MRTNPPIQPGKVVIIGAGRVGASVAYALMLTRAAREVVLLDAHPSRAHAEAMDIAHGFPNLSGVRVRAGAFSDCVDAAVILLTAGRSRRPGEDRQQLFQGNAAILRDILVRTMPHNPLTVWIVVTNPVDTLTACVQRWTGLPAQRVIGTGCLLDSSRLISQVSRWLRLPPERLCGHVAGEHGDAQFPLWSLFTVDGIPLEVLFARAGMAGFSAMRQRVADSVRDMGASIIRDKGATFYGVASCIAVLVDAIVHDRRAELSVCGVFQGEYGISDVALSFPSVVDKGGATRMPLPISREELMSLHAAAEKMRAVLRPGNRRGPAHMGGTPFGSQR